MYVRWLTNYGQYLQKSGASAEDRSVLAYRRGMWMKKGEERRRLLLESTADQWDREFRILDIILDEADQPENAKILGKLAKQFGPGRIRTQLLWKQANLTATKKEAADIEAIALATCRREQDSSKCLDPPPPGLPRGFSGLCATSNE